MHCFKECLEGTFGDVGLQNLDQWELKRVIQRYICVLYYPINSELENWCEKVYSYPVCVKLARGAKLKLHNGRKVSRVIRN